MRTGLLAEEDFDNDAVDAGDIGAGHQVTALYEIVPAGSRGWLPDRRYPANRREAEGDRQWRARLPAAALQAARPGPVAADRAAGPGRPGRARARAPIGDTAFVAAVAAYGQLLRGDTNMGRFTFADVAVARRPGARRRLLAARVRPPDRARRAAAVRRRRQVESVPGEGRGPVGIPPLGPGTRRGPFVSETPAS